MCVSERARAGGHYDIFYRKDAGIVVIVVIMMINKSKVMIIISCNFYAIITHNMNHNDHDINNNATIYNDNRDHISNTNDNAITDKCQC